MGFYCLRAGDNVRSGECKEFICDTAADIAELPKLEKCAPGSTAFVIATGGRYMLNTAGVWKKLPKGAAYADEIECRYTDIGGQEYDTVQDALGAIGYDMGLLQPPHIVISLTSTSDGPILTGATKNGAAISLTNASGTADYTALLAAINSAVPKGGNVELYVNDAEYYSGAVYRGNSGVIITYYDVVNPTDINDGATFYRCDIRATHAEISGMEI